MSPRKVSSEVTLKSFFEDQYLKYTSEAILTSSWKPSVKTSCPFRSTLNTDYITGLDMCKVCTEAVQAVHFEHGLHYRFGHVSKVCTTVYVPQHFEHGLHYRFGHV